MMLGAALDSECLCAGCRGTGTGHRMGQESRLRAAPRFQSGAGSGQGCPGKHLPACQVCPPPAIPFHSKHRQRDCHQQELVPGPQGEAEQQATPALGSPVHRQADRGRSGKCSSWERTWAEVCGKGCDIPPILCLAPPCLLLPSLPTACTASAATAPLVPADR